MPEFCNPFSVLKGGRKLTHEELVRAIRFMIAAEYEAIQRINRPLRVRITNLQKKFY